MENNHTLFFRTFMVVIIFSFVLSGLLMLERMMLHHAGTGMYGTPTPPYVAVILRHTNAAGESAHFIEKNIDHIAAFLTYGN